MSALVIAVGTFTAVAVGSYFALGGGAHGMRARFMRYAGDPLPDIDPLPAGASQVALPRAWEAYLASAGVAWTGEAALARVAAAVVLGAAVGYPLGLAMPAACAAPLLLFAWIATARSRRTRTMAEQLPDALMLMATALKSGLGFQQAVQLVAVEGPSPLAPELARLGQDMALGVAMDEALVRLQTRLGSTDGEMLAAALLVQRQTGGNLVEILGNLHDTIRDRQLVQGQVRTLTAQGRLSGLVLAALPIAIALALYVLNREYLMVLVTDPRGQMMTAGAALLFAGGVAMIRRIVSITL